MYFGFSLGDTEKGEVEVTSIQPGGPAWSSGAIHKDDVLLKMKWETKEPVDLAGLDAEEVNSLLDASNTEKLDLTVRKKSGEIQTVVLQKRKLENDENIVKSFVLRGTKNIGYITLPSFYTQWGDAAGSSCANDVAKEIIKLKKDTISGLILDLRYNGGGSLQEAIEMAGIFIDEGGLCQLKMKESNAKEPKMVTLKDVNRGLIYNGPMILMVNGYSASASELLAGSLQDYNRALIVGTRTYGKATGQEIKQAGDAFVKLTNLKLYRITGKTAQFQGVHPDVDLPDPYSSFAEFESDNEFAIKPDTVSAYKYFKPLKPLVKTNLQQQSMARVKNQKFDALNSNAKELEAKMQPRKISLKWDAIEQALKNDKKSSTQNILRKPTSLFASYNNTADQKFINGDSAAKEINNRWLERISQDPYIEETYLIMLDFIQLNK
jgi:carboxyl-terminal processing protease